LVVVAVVAAGCGNGGGDGTGDRPKLPVSSDGGSAAGGGASAAMMKSEVATDAAAGSSAPAFAPVRPVEYRLGASAKAPATSAHAFRLRKVDGVTGRVAKALGVDPSHVSSDSPYGDWWYSADDAGGGSGVASSVAVACAPDEPCETTPLPALEGVPTADEARAKAKAILDALGVDVAADALDVQGEDGQWRTVSATGSVGGVPVPMLTTTITFGEHGRVQNANGFLIQTDDLGAYPLVSLADAFDRYQHGFGGGVETMGAPAEAIPDSRPAKGAPTGEATAASGGTGVSGAATTGSAGSASGSGDSGSATSGSGTATAGTATNPAESPPPSATDAPCAADGPNCGVPQPPVSVEPQIVEVTGARLVLEPAGTGCIDDSVYLVPAFELRTDGDAPASEIGSVTAVADDALQAPASGDTPDQPCPEDQVDQEEPVGKPEPAPVPSDAGSVEPQPAPAPANAPNAPSAPTTKP
jgi:hypothetical protein